MIIIITFQIKHKTRLLDQQCGQAFFKHDETYSKTHFHHAPILPSMCCMPSRLIFKDQDDGVNVGLFRSKSPLGSPPAHPKMFKGLACGRAA